MRQAILIYNPTSGRQLAQRLSSELHEILKRGGFEVEPSPTRAPGHATELARRAAQSGTVDTVFTLGGDGTFREAAAGLLGSRVPLGLLPGGTANVLARALGLPRKPLDAARLVGTLSEPREIDVGLCGDEPFLMMASGGLDAEVMAFQNAALKRRIGRAAFAFSGLQRWWRYGYPEITARSDGAQQKGTLFVASNIPLYGGGFRIAPDADPADGQLDCVLFRGQGRAATLGLALALAFGRHSRRPDIDIRKATEIEILGPESLRIQLDGDSVDLHPPLTIRLAPHRLRVWMP